MDIPMEKNKVGSLLLTVYKIKSHINKLNISIKSRKYFEKL